MTRRRSTPCWWTCYRVAPDAGRRASCLDVDATDDPAARPAGRAVLPRVLPALLLSASVYLLRRAGALRAVAALEPRRGGRGGGRGGADCGAGAAGMAVGLHPGAGRLGVLPRRAAELVRRACGGLRHRLGEERSVEGTHRGPNWRRPRHSARKPGPPRGCLRTSAIARARAGAGSAGWSARPSICPRAPIHASW